MSRTSDLDNHADQLNPNNDAYWESRGFDERPDQWEEQASEKEGEEQKDSEGARRGGVRPVGDSK